MYDRCQKCGKRLSDPESKQRGYGPECWGRIVGIAEKIKDGMEEADIPGQMDFSDFKEIFEEEE